MTTIDAMKQAASYLDSLPSSVAFETKAEILSGKLREAIAAEEAQEKRVRPKAGDSLLRDDGSIWVVSSVTGDYAYTKNADGRYHTVNIMYADYVNQGSSVAEPHESESVAGSIPASDRPANCGSGHCSCVECVMPAPTGWDNGLSQDYCKGLGQWLANRPGARQQLREMLAADHVEDVLAMVPMTPDQISDVYFQSSNQHLRPCDKYLVTLFVEAIEAHHGIK